MFTSLRSLLTREGRKASCGEQGNLTFIDPLLTLSSKGALLVAPSSQEFVFPKVTKHHRNIFLTKTWKKRILAYVKEPSVPKI